MFMYSCINANTYLHNHNTNIHLSFNLPRHHGIRNIPKYIRNIHGIGLFVPCDKAKVPRYDSFFLRATSYDIPSEGKSAFAIEMDDMHIVLRDSTNRWV